MGETIVRIITVPIVGGTFRCPYEVASNDRDAYYSAVCPNCQQLHSLNPANGQILAEDGLGDPW
jgi:hypothetical protein